MRGTLYTSYFYRYIHNEDAITDNDITIIVARNVQEWLQRESFTEHIKDLAPSNSLRYKYKDGSISDNEFRREYIKEICKSRGQAGLQKIRDYLDNGHNVYIYCYESDYNECHRLPLAVLLNAYGYNVVLR